MKDFCIDREKELIDLETQIQELREKHGENFQLHDEIQQLEKKCEQRLQEIFSDLSPWEITQLARCKDRPYTLDYINMIFTDFEELHGDRQFSDDAAIVGGIARLDNQAVMIIGHQKGRDTKEKIKRNFGMPRPEGYRKALRLMKLAERFNMPIITLIDTPGAYPGIDAEERGQSEAIARNLFEMAELQVPIIACVIGEGGSGGALAIGVADTVMMLSYSVYSVISPEGCASILWKSAEKAPEAAQALNITSYRLKELGLVDKVIEEPLGGAHRCPEKMGEALKNAFITEVNQLKGLDVQALLQKRYDKFMAYGSVAIS